MTSTDAGAPTPSLADSRPAIIAACVLAGVCIAAAMPPWGWWPLAFVGFAIVDRLLATPSAKARMWRLFGVGVAWLFPAMIWMLDLTPPGYVIAALAYSLGFGLAGAASPASRWRRLAFPGAMVIAELARWSIPFGGVPLATLPMSQSRAPLAPTVRVFGSLMLVALVVAIGMGLAALVERHWPSVAAIGVAVLAAVALTAVAPSGTPVDTIAVAIVQGGGEQRTRASPEGARVVFERHIEASAQVTGPVDLVLWPENVVNPALPRADGSRSESRLYADEAAARLSQVAAEIGAPVLPGWFESVSDTETVNYTDVRLPDGTVGDRYDKVRTVPFGEFVPLRGLIEPFAGGALPPREVRPGTDPAVLNTPVGPLGVVISWEVFFDHRARDAIGNGGQLLLNPTNGSSYWLTIVQTQQLASSRLRALETGRWVLQAAPTGFSAIVNPDGEVVSRTSIGEQAVIQGEVELRTGLTWANRLGVWPMVAFAVLALAVSWLASGRRPT